MNYKNLFVGLQKITHPETILTTITFPVGAALKKIDSSNFECAELSAVNACLSGATPIIFPDGRVMACIGPVIELNNNHPLLLGNLNSESFEEIIESAGR